MRRATRVAGGILVALAILVLVAVGVVWWAASTRAGAEWAVARITNENVQVAAVDGRLVGPLVLHGVEFQAGDGQGQVEGEVEEEAEEAPTETQVRVERLRLDWSPRALLRRRVRVTALEAAGVTVRLAEAAEEPDPPELPEVDVPWVDVLLERARVRDLRIHRPDADEPLVVEEVRAAGRIEGSRLTLDELAFRTADASARAEGVVTLAGAYPLDVRVEWRASVPAPATGEEAAASAGQEAAAAAAGDPAAPSGARAPSAHAPESTGAARQPAASRGAADRMLLAGVGRVGGSLEELRVEHRLTEPVEARVTGTIVDPLDGDALAWQAELDVPRFRLALLREDLAPNELGLRADVSGGVDRLSGGADFVGALEPVGEVTGDARFAWADEALRVEALELALPETGGAVTAAGVVALDAEPPRFEITGEWSGLAVPEAPVASAEGRFAASGTPRRYDAEASGRISLDVLPEETGGVLEGWWAARAEGTDGDANVRVEAELLEGRMEGAVAIAWAPELEWDVSVEGAGLNPGVLLPERAGALDVRIASRGGVRDGELVADVELERMEGEIAGVEVDARADVGIRADTVDVRSARVRAATAVLAAEGAVGERWGLDWRIDVPDVGELAPLLGPARGTLLAEGEVDGERDAPRVTAALEGDSLTLRDVRARRLEATLDVDLSDARPSTAELRVEAAGADFLAADLDFELDASGTTASHEALFRASPVEGGPLTLRLEGGLEDGRWEGVLADAAVDPVDMEPWRLREPAALAFGPEEIRLARACLDGGAAASAPDAAPLPGPGASPGAAPPSGPAPSPGPPPSPGPEGVTPADPPGMLCAEGAWRPEAGARGSLAVTSFPLRMVSRWMPDFDIEGSLALEAEATLPPERTAEAAAPAAEREAEASLPAPERETEAALPAPEREAEADVAAGPASGTSPAAGGMHLVVAMEAGPGVLRYPRAAAEPVSRDYERISLDARIDAGALAANALLRFNADEQLEAELRATAGASPEEQHLSGHLRGELEDRGLAGLVVPDLNRTEGTVRVDLVPAGTRANPALAGSVTVREAASGVIPLGIRLEEVAIDISAEEGGAWDVTAGARSGPGSLEVEGRVLLPGAEAEEFSGELRVRGERFLAYSTPLARVVATPDLSVALAPDRVEVTGEVSIPQAAIAPRDLEGVAEVSPDVVVVRGELPGEDEEAPLELFASVRVEMGEEVQLDAFGLTGRLEGALVVDIEPERDPAGRGELQVVEGQYTALRQTLEVERARLLYADGPLSNPGLDVRVVRETGDVLAGMEIGGTAEQPVAELFSEPSMPEADVLSYLVLGRPATFAGEEEGDALGQAAAALGVAGAQQLAGLGAGVLGLDEARIETEDGEGLEQASLVLGTYLSPRLWVGYGIGLFEATNVLRLRYQLGTNWLLQTESGTHSGADLIYSVEQR